MRSLKKFSVLLAVIGLLVACQEDEAGEQIDVTSYSKQQEETMNEQNTAISTVT